MGKAISFLFAVILLLLAACDKAPRGGETEFGESLEGTDTAAVSVPYVLKNAPEDQNQAWSGCDFVETPEGYYVCEKGESVGLLCFCPRGGDSFRPLCSKPNCKHEDEDCNAFLGWGNFGYYNDALYSVNIDGGDRQLRFVLVERKMDGTDHREVATLDDTNLKNCSYQFIFHHGKLFVFCRADYDLPLEEQVNHLVVLDLADYSQKELASEFLRTASLPEPFSFYKDKLYLLGTGDKSQTYENYNPYDEKLFEVDAVTGELRTAIPSYVNGLYVTDSTLYYYEPDLGPNGYEAGNVEPGFREYDAESGTIKDCGQPKEDILWARYDEDFIYGGSFYRNNDKEQTIYFLTRDYKVLDLIELQNGMQIYAIASDRIYFFDPIQHIITHYIDKSKIGSGELELIPIKMAG